MATIQFLLKSLVAGVVIGISIIAVDWMYVEYVGSHRVELIRKEAHRLKDGFADIVDIASIGNYPNTEISIFGSRIDFNERCRVYLDHGPRLSCEDFPFSTSAYMHARDEIEESRETLRRMASPNSWTERQEGEFLIYTYIVETKRLQEILDEERQEPRPEPPGTPVPMLDTEPTHNAVICDSKTCLTIMSGSKTTVEGLLGQIVHAQK